ncbi:hypothetical protein SAMN05216227_10378 [Pseudorhodobacter antarcticus]|jgi:hypothetical protein|uniref:Uncharacterized protein n=1 Tax=Pseudorhodobacter antarcticus TaxID=1077947 RepID=A0A1H8L071_9RHOB|nr:hypothetical protein SAMN05216227_10378 [Pseudorhodobacter antarcticus]
MGPTANSFAPAQMGICSCQTEGAGRGWTKSHGMADSGAEGLFGTVEWVFHCQLGLTRRFPGGGGFYRAGSGDVLRRPCCGSPQS